MEKFAEAIGYIILGLFIAVIVSLLMAWLTQIAWRDSVGEIFHFPNITYWQAFWLNMLGSQLFKSYSTSSSK